jgi:outer membrane protein assembly factor BamE (lipoprotein component of BamABCDE complex)
MFITFARVIISAIAQSQNSSIYFSKSGLPKEITNKYGAAQSKKAIPEKIATPGRSKKKRFPTT